MKKLIKVTKQHIKEGAKEEAFSCPVANAVRESYGFDRVGVCDDHIYISNDVDGASHNTTVFDPWPRSVVRFIERFDTGKPVKPFNFYIDI